MIIGFDTHTQIGTIETRQLPLTCFGQGVEAAAEGHHAHLMNGFEGPVPSGKHAENHGKKNAICHGKID